MSTPNARTWYYHLDPELKIIHVFVNCGSLKFPKKYSYVKDFTLRGREDAIELDRMVRHDNWKVCVPCWKREQMLARQDTRPPRPGFKSTPPGVTYDRPRTHRTTGRRGRKPTTKE